tara:strand:- start:4398 stop:4637 length:240 start_codon:yes stop_codon:yes gene_type:complete
MAKKKQTYTIGEPQKKSVKKITHSIEPLPKKKSKPQKRKKPSHNQKSFKSNESNNAPLNNAFAEAFAKAGITKESFAKK